MPNSLFDESNRVFYIIIFLVIGIALYIRYKDKKEQKEKYSQVYNSNNKFSNFNNSNNSNNFKFLNSQSE